MVLLRRLPLSEVQERGPGVCWPLRGSTVPQLPLNLKSTGRKMSLFEKTVLSLGNFKSLFIVAVLLLASRLSSSTLQELSSVSLYFLFVKISVVERQD